MNLQSSKDILTALVGFDTVSRNSNLDLIAWVEKYLDSLGVKHERIYDETGKKSNLWATIGPADVPGYILSGHTDVVPVDDQNWTNDPFTLTERDGKLYGRGATDMKGYVACCLAAVPDMLKADLKKPLHLAFSYDEEVGCFGARRMIDQVLPAPAGRRSGRAHATRPRRIPGPEDVSDSSVSSKRDRGVHSEFPRFGQLRPFARALPRESTAL